MIKARELVQSGTIGKPLIVLDDMSITYGFVLPWYREQGNRGRWRVYVQRGAWL